MRTFFIVITLVVAASAHALVERQNATSPTSTNPGGPMMSSMTGMSMSTGMANSCSFAAASTMPGGSVMPAMTMCAAPSLPSGCMIMPAETVSGSVMPAMTMCATSSSAADSNSLKVPTDLAGFLAILGFAFAM